MMLLHCCYTVTRLLLHSCYNVVDRVTDVDMSENKDIPDQPWPHMRDVLKCGLQKGFLVNALRV